MSTYRSSQTIPASTLPASTRSSSARSSQSLASPVRSARSGLRNDRPLVVGLDLSAAGAPHSTWRIGGTRRPVPLDAERLYDIVATAERGLLDFVAFDEDFRLQSDSASPNGGALDAAVISSRLAKRTAAIGLVPTISVSAIDPVHVAAAANAVDAASRGRGAWQAGAGTTAATIRAVTQNWASDAAAAGPDRASLPPVVVRAEGALALDTAGQLADVVRILAHDEASAYAQRQRVRKSAQKAGRNPDDVLVLVELYAVTGHDRVSARTRLELVESIEGERARLDSVTVVGTHGDLADLAQKWFVGDAVDGFVITPSSLQTDVFGVVDGVLPILRERGLFRGAYPGRTLASTLGLERGAVRELSLSA
ncbi:MAG: hypothetical protein ACTMIR_12585 [Cellulomonadaceae bacterium]